VAESVQVWSVVSARERVVLLVNPPRTPLLVEVDVHRGTPQRRADERRTGTTTSDFAGHRLGSQRHDDPALDEACRLLALLGCNEIDGSELVIFSPAAPVRQLLHPPFELLLGRTSRVFVAALTTSTFSHGLPLARRLLR